MLSVSQDSAHYFDWFFDQPIVVGAGSGGTGLQLQDTLGTWHNPIAYSGDTFGDVTLQYPSGVTYLPTAAYQTTSAALSFGPPYGVAPGQSGNAS